jgi:lysophospholipase L1-like esterase
MSPLSIFAQGIGGGRGGPASRPAFVPEGYDDKRHMMEQLGVRALRPGANPNTQFSEETANPYKDYLPDLLKMSDGTKVTRAEQWPARRAEILELFEREFYGRIPADVPKVTWEVTATTPGEAGGIPTVTKTLVGRVDNSAFPQITVNIQASFTVPANTMAPVPVLLEFGGGGFGFGGRGRGGAGAGARGATSGPATNRAATAPPGFGRGGGGIPWTQQAIARGWGYGFVNPNSIQRDGGGDALRQGIIGLTNKGQPRTPDQWGALRAWGWGVSRLIDYFEANPDAKVDPRKVGIEGVSRYGKAALVTQAFDERVAVAFVASSGAGGAKLLRHVFGEALENLTGGGYYWFAGNLIKYGASDATFGAKTAADLPVDAHQLIALCAPRPCFISYGVIAAGDPQWVDAGGSFMATVLASPAYELLGAKGLGTPGEYLTDPMPPVGQLVGGQLAWRQHEGGHTSVPNFPTFFQWIDNYIKAPELPKKLSMIQSIPRTDANSRLAHGQLLAKAKQGKINVYFLGDSITRRWGATDYPKYLAHWRESFHGWNAANFGWGADRIQNILWRIENGELDDVHPKIIVLQAGTNDIPRSPADEQRLAELAQGLHAIIQLCQKKAPDAVIILTAIFPRNDNPNANAAVAKANENLARLADGKSIRYLNINGSLADQDGVLLDGMMNADKLHPDLKAYQVWADALKPIFTELLGPPAKDDHAPPPTGDPSVAAAATRG